MLGHEIDDHSGLAFTEVHADDKAETTRVLAQAVAFFSYGITIERVTTDNPGANRMAGRIASSLPSTASVTSSSARTAHGRTSRSNASTAPSATEWPYGQVFASNDERAAALAPWLVHYDTERRHRDFAGRPFISQIK